MKMLAMCAAGALLAFAGPAQAIPVSAISQADFRTTFQIDNGADTPVGLDNSDTLTFTRDASSSLASADAVNDSGETAMIAGTSPATPSSFTGFDRTTRNGGTEGAEADWSQFVYGVRAVDADPANGSGIVNNGISGSASAQAQITTDPFDTAASATVLNQRDFTFRNLTQSELFFTITGEMELSVATQFIGAEGIARSFVGLDLIFDSEDPVNISFAPLAPFLPQESTTGDNSATTLTRATDPSGEGRVGLSASASSLGIDDLDLGFATVAASQSYVLGVTLLPGQVLTMSRVVSYIAAVDVQPLVSQVPLPASLPLLASGLLGLGILRVRARARAS